MNVGRVLNALEFKRGSAGNLEVYINGNIRLEQLTALKDLIGAKQVHIYPTEPKALFVGNEESWNDHEDLLKNKSYNESDAHLWTTLDEEGLEVERFTIEEPGDEPLEFSVDFEDPREEENTGANEQKQESPGSESNDEEEDEEDQGSQTGKNEETPCPECESNNTYDRKNAEPTWKCYKCGHVWNEEPDDEQNSEVDVDLVVAEENHSNQCPQCFGDNIKQRLVQSTYVWECQTCGATYRVEG